MTDGQSERARAGVAGRGGDGAESLTSRLRFGAAAAVYYGRREDILKRRKDEKQATLGRRFRDNLGQAPNPTLGELRTEL